MDGFKVCDVCVWKNAKFVSGSENVQVGIGLRDVIRVYDNVSWFDILCNVSCVRERITLLGSKDFQQIMCYKITNNYWIISINSNIKFGSW